MAMILDCPQHTVNLNTTSLQLLLSLLRAAELLGDVRGTQILSIAVTRVLQMSSVNTISMGSIANTIALVMKRQ
jgi:hypothetical protein